MCAPLYDNYGKIRYFLGAQVDISSMVNEGADLESLQRLIEQKERRRKSNSADEEKKDEFQELSEMLDIQELNAVRKWGGRMLQEHQEEDTGSQKVHWRRPTILLRDPSRDFIKTGQSTGGVGGQSLGVYQNVRLPNCLQLYPANRTVSAYPALSVLAYSIRFSFLKSTGYPAIADNEQDRGKRPSTGRTYPGARRRERCHCKSALVVKVG